MQQLVKIVSTSTLLATILAFSGCGGDGKDSRSLSLEEKGIQNTKISKPSKISTLSVAPIVNKAPTAEDFSFSIHKSANYFGELKALDSDGDELIFTLKDKPKMGNVELSKNGMFVYTSCVGKNR